MENQIIQMKSQLIELQRDSEELAKKEQIYKDGLYMTQIPFALEYALMKNIYDEELRTLTGIELIKLKRELRNVTIDQVVLTPDQYLTNEFKKSVWSNFNEKITQLGLTNVKELNFLLRWLKHERVCSSMYLRNTKFTFEELKSKCKSVFHENEDYQFDAEIVIKLLQFLTKSDTLVL